MPDCYVKGCKSRSCYSRKNKTQLQWEKSEGKNITFHKIPKNAKERSKWLDAVKLNDTDVPMNAKLCSLHFAENAFDRTSVNCKIECINHIDASHKKEKILNEGVNEENDPKAIEIFDIRKDPVQDTYADIHETTIMKNTSTLSIFKETKTACQQTIPRKVKNQATSVSPHLLEDTPTERLLRTALVNTKKELHKTIKCLRQKHRRYKKRIAHLQNVLLSLKKKKL
ncbi:uncharacterized protein LOC116849497 isoform X2 [Odontomachus brunneus]|uniref:uncharacterized protein LOC116849497 isoform X2 n=1 Tax=Odontomachus brunneus TaxID=486640 RepID=UPI0013F24EC8|nr:uncharacterized protein LOC116849497 isoform X2 [Odontomachus brunneus]